MKVSKKNIKIWCQALRSGKYKQGKNELQSIQGYCCLGVACKVFIPKDELRMKNYNNQLIAGGMPSCQNLASLWLKEIDRNFENKTGKHLSELNDDDQFTFDEIADCLEAVYIHEVLK